MKKKIALTVMSLGLLASTIPASATTHTFEVDGTGTNGTLATAVFTTDDPQTTPGYVGDSTAFTSITLSLTNIPAGPGSYTETKADGVGNSTYFVTGDGTVMTAPAGQYPGTGGFVYRLSGWLGDGVHSPLTSQLEYANSANNTLSQVDIITWSPAEQIEAAPEPATITAGALTSAALLLSFLRRQKSQREKR